MDIETSGLKTGAKERKRKISFVEEQKTKTKIFSREKEREREHRGKVKVGVYLESNTNISCGNIPIVVGSGEGTEGRRKRNNIFCKKYLLLFFTPLFLGQRIVESLMLILPQVTIS